MDCAAEQQRDRRRCKELEVSRLLYCIMRNSIYSITLDEAISAVGGHHTYQRRALSIYCFLCFAAGVSASSIVFLTQKAEVECSGADCQKDNPCASSHPTATPHSPKTPAKDWGLICEREVLVAVVAWLYPAGVAVGAVLCACFERSFPRLRAANWSAGLALLAGVAVCGSPSIYVFYGAVPLKAIADVCVVLCSSIGILETVGGEYRSWFIGALAMTTTAGVLTGYGFSLVFPNWRIVAALAPMLYVLSQPLFRSLVESPRFLAAIKGKFAAARSVLQHISATNGRPHFNDMLEGEKVIGYQEIEKPQTVGDTNSSNTRDVSGKLVFVPITVGIVSVSQGDTRNTKKYYYLDLLRLESVRTVMLVCGMAWIGGVATVCSLREVPGNDTPWAVVTMRLVDIAAIALTSALVNKMGRLSVVITYLAICGLCCVLTIAFISPNCHPEGLCHINAVMRGLMLHVARVFAQAEAFLLFLYCLELFPTVVRLSGLSVCVALGAVVHCAWNAVAEFVRMELIPVLLLSGVTCLLISILACILPDTSPEELQDYVAEEVEEMKKPAELSQVEIHASSNSDTTRRLQSKDLPFQVMNEERPASLNVP